MIENRIFIENLPLGYISEAFGTLWHEMNFPKKTIIFVF